MKTKLFYLLLSMATVVAAGTTSFAQDDDDGGRINWFPSKGNVGINVGRRNTATEKLEVIGNVKVSQTIFTNNLETVGLKATSFTVAQDATIGRNLIVNGNTGLGIAAPTERLEVSGNIKATQKITSDQLATGDGVFSRNVQIAQTLSARATLALAWQRLLKNSKSPAM
jgi:hypothetical protein